MIFDARMSDITAFIVVLRQLTYHLLESSTQIGPRSTAGLRFSHRHVSEMPLR